MKGGIDRGWCLLYKHLSYRRKLIRTVWANAVLIAMICFTTMGVNQFFDTAVLIGVSVITIAAGATAIHNAIRWQQERRELSQ